MQTSISFSNHQIDSPGTDEFSARRALKCCMFGALLSHIQRVTAASKTLGQDPQRLLAALKARQRRQSTHGESAAGEIELEQQIQSLEQQLIDHEPRLDRITQHLDFVAGMLSRPEAFIRPAQCSVRLNRQAVKLAPDSAEKGFEVEVAEIHMASHDPRIGAPVRFPRDELLRRPDMLKQADLFLAI